MRDLDPDRPETPFTGVTYHSSHASDAARPKSQVGFTDDAISAIGGLGGLVQPKAKKQNFIKRILESAKTGVASSRGSIATAGAASVQPSSVARATPNGVTAISGGGFGVSKTGRDAAKEMGLGNGVDWVQVRRDVNRSNSLSRNERVERKERCQMLDYPAIDPVDELYNSIDGDEGADGNPIPEPTDYMAINLSQVDKNSRFIASLPPMTTAITLATTYVCRPYRSDVQRLRAIFTWVSEKVCWEEDFDGPVDTRRVIHTKRACAEEYAVLVMEMCTAVGLHCEIVRGYLKSPGEILDAGIVPRSNHWWNAVLVDNEWRMMDCCLASPSNPRRGLYSSVGGGTADFWYFLARPTEICWTHIPEHHSQQHICPPVAHEILLNLPCACPPYFKNGLHMADYNTSLTRIEDLEMMHIKFNVPADVEVAAEVEVRAYSRDSDGDFFESGDVVKKRALAQAEWFGGVKRYTVKALLPGDEGTGTLKVYAGKRGLMHSIKDIPHPLAFALPIIHTGENPPYEFVTRHPTPHAQRHDIYVVQPQCQRLALNNTFVFAIRQHPSSLGASPMTPSSNPGGASPIPFVRPGSAMSMTSSSAAGSNPSTSTANGTSGSTAKKPAKLAIQTPGGKILRLMRKEERRGGGVGVGARTNAAGNDEESSDGGTWETIIKCSERGVWRGLVLADRTARWCVFAEWVCQG
ncbi:putative cytokinesis protein cyk3 protein [Diplogelasinospora grovesii]|uniref:Cytokinesis protein cyk3 protein n=1 Tax=Diplogelasinospora grovesii TaxID=303347 RepID=A0AAN6NE59_9PEZI|nr:putative cytokinesis protein cyk3 protein [Diplogelasinospora grovesii]